MMIIVAFTVNQFFYQRHLDVGVRWHLDTDDTKTITLKASPSSSGNVDLQLPTSARTLMRTADDLDSRNLVHGNLLASVTPVDDDAWLIYDASDSNEPKRVLGSSLKTYVGSASLPSATEAQMLVANSSGVYAGQTLSGDASVNASGVLTLANDSVGTAQVEAGAITAPKVNIKGATLLSGQVVAADEMLLYDASSTSNVKVPMSAVASYVSAKLSVGSVSSVKIVDGAIKTAKVASDAITTVKIADANITTAKVADANITTDKVADDAITSAKLAAAIALDTSVQAPVVYVGNNKWKMELSTNDLVFSYWNGSA
jgi:hypothetical protein